MKRKKPVYIVANTLPAEFGWGTMAPGLRAQQLANQARCAGAEATYIIMSDRYKLINNERRSAILIGPRSDTQIVQREDFQTLTERLPSGVLVFTQTDYADLALTARDRHTIVYDILAPKMLELQDGGHSQQDIVHARAQHIQLIGLAERIFVNGEKTKSLYSAELCRHLSCVVNRFAPMSHDFPRHCSPRYLVFGGKVQKWYDYARLLSVMSTFLNTRPSMRAIAFCSPAPLNSPLSRDLSALKLLANVRVIEKVGLRTYNEILASTLGFVDVSIDTEERQYSTSTRTLQAIGSGAPVLHQKPTGLDHFWKDFPGKRIYPEELNVDKVDEFTENAVSGEYAERCTIARASQREIYNDPKPFEGLL